MPCTITSSPARSPPSTASRNDQTRRVEKKAGYIYWTKYPVLGLPNAFLRNKAVASLIRIPVSDVFLTLLVKRANIGTFAIWTTRTVLRSYQILVGIVLNLSPRNHLYNVYGNILTPSIQTDIRVRYPTQRKLYGKLYYAIMVSGSILEINTGYFRLPRVNVKTADPFDNSSPGCNAH
ncbi:uncharacterized protein BT62DRAFT_1074749 [Guyanagaster necrorhizus]|uniref:Uncharacterized protein n=1 Tax=Guyanagaster necrorhizus TaxID=856835 RepID=A0A9P7VVG0_9AGAR|nr:uncharacterized protein BT62DRAFT_1074749 [Guyanagaster necrorhizus MCA 3950]KAG7448261.1 hypothetical protein BT62DRAFT_1074749 [Guyanagaster necrorhizus MCA 3950]